MVGAGQRELVEQLGNSRKFNAPTYKWLKTQLPKWPLHETRYGWDQGLFSSLQRFVFCTPPDLWWTHSCTNFKLKRKKCLWIPRAHFPISTSIKGIDISCSTGFQQPFWKLIGFDPASSGGKKWLEFEVGDDNNGSVQTQVLPGTRDRVLFPEGAASCIEP